MSNPFYGEAEADLGKRKLKLVFNFGAVAAIENHPYGASFQTLSRELASGESKISTWAVVLWGCLRAKHSTISYEDAGEMLLVDETAEPLMVALQSCIEMAFPKTEGEVANPRKRRGPSKAT